MSTRMTDPNIILTLHGRDYETALTRKFANRKPYQPKDPDRLMSIIPGLILELFVQPGDAVKPGQSLLILEAMKMQNHVKATRSGTVQRLHVALGETVTKGQLLVEFEPGAE